MTHDLREVLRWAAGREAPPTAVIFDSATRQSTPESGARAGYDGYKRRQGSKVHAAVATLGHLLALAVTPANEQDRAQVAALAEAVQAATGQTVELACVDQGYTGDRAEADAAAHGIRLEVVTLAEAKRGFVLLPRRWIVERAVAWVSRFRRLAKDYERLPEVVAGLPFLAVVSLMLHRLVHVVAQSPSQALAAGAMLVFALSFGEFARAQLLVGARFETVSLYSLDLLARTNADFSTLAVLTVLTGVILFAMSIAVVMLNRDASGRLLPGAKLPLERRAP